MATGGTDRLSQRERSEVVLASYKLDHAFEGWDGAVPSFVAVLARFGLEPNMDLIEQVHQGDGVCAAEVRALLPALRQMVSQARDAQAQAARAQPEE